MGPKLMTVKDLADLLGAKPRWVYANYRLEGIPYVKLRQGVRFDSADVHAWIDARKVRPDECNAA